MRDGVGAVDGAARGRGLSPGKKACFAAVVCLVVLAAVEVGARVYSAGEDVPTRFAQIEQVVIHLGSEPGELMFEPDEDRFWRLKPGLTLPAKGDKRWSGMIANSLGFRNREFSPQKQAGSYRIVCVGDSTTFGFGVDWDEAWPHVLEEWLNAESGGRPIEVVNAGVPGYSSHQGLEYARQLLPELEPDLVIVTFGNNDGWSWDNHTDREFAERLQDGTGSSLLSSSRAVQLGTLWYRSRFGGQQERPDHRWADDVWSYRTAPDWQPRVPVDEFAENLSAIALLCRRAGSEVMLVKWPDRIQVGGTPTLRQRYLDAIEAVCADKTVARADVVGVFQARSAETWQMYLPNDNIHVDAAGNVVAAEVIADAVREVVGSGRLLGN